MDLAKPGTFLINGRPVLTCANANYKIASGDQELDLLILGSGNFSDGATKISINGEFAILPAGQEFDFDTTCALHQTVRVGYKTGDRTITASGRFLDVDGSMDPNKPSTRKVNFSGAIVAIV